MSFGGFLNFRFMHTVFPFVLIYSSKEIISIGGIKLKIRMKRSDDRTLGFVQS